MKAAERDRIAREGQSRSRTTERRTFEAAWDTKATATPSAKRKPTNAPPRPALRNAPPKAAPSPQKKITKDELIDNAVGFMSVIALGMIAYDIYLFNFIGQMSVSYQARYGYITKGTMALWGTKETHFPNLAIANFFDMLGYVLTIIGFAIWNVMLFAWFVFTQPIIYNVPAWFIIAITACLTYLNLKERAGVTGPLDILERQKAFGDAAPASREAIHAAMSGQSVPNAPRFKD